MKKMMVVAVVLSALFVNFSMVNECFAASKSGTVLGNKKINPYELFQVNDAATCLEDILGGKKADSK